MHTGGVGRYSPNLSLTLAHGHGLLVLAPATLPLGMTQYHYIRGWVSPCASLDRCRETRQNQDLNPGPSRP